MPDASENKKVCFVVMGFGIKTDFATGRKLNLDYSYQALIKPVIEAKGLTCIRADEMKHSGYIDVPMYQQLLTADVVVADISTANPNALYELGIRHAMRPRTTIVISEKQLAYPFDLNHILITKYDHRGDSIDYYEVINFQKTLGNLLDSVINTTEADSPVYTFLSDLIPPSLQKKAEDVARKVGVALKAEGNKQPLPSEDNQTLSILVKQAEDALKERDFETAKNLFESCVLISKANKREGDIAHDAYLFQRLALCTYKTKKPDVISSLFEAITTLQQLDLGHTNDPETVALAGKIEKRLYDNGQGDVHLKNAILYYERGYFLLHNRYHGINLAFLLNKRVDTSIYTTNEDKIADMAWASRIRMEVLKMCEEDWTDILARQDTLRRQDANVDEKLTNDQLKAYEEQKFWILVNRAEAFYGLGMPDKSAEAFAEAQKIEHTEYMLKAYTDQNAKLRSLMQKYGHLLNPAWKE